MSYLSKFRLQHACQQLKAGRILAYPTEAVYGLGCDPLNQMAVNKLLTLKQRSIDKGLILIGADFSQLEMFLDYDEKILRRMQEPTSAVITWVVPAQSWVPKCLKGQYETLAVRITTHPLANALCQQFNGSIVSTSANLSHRKPAGNALQVRGYFPKQPQLNILSGETGGFKTPSKIYDALTGMCLRY